jgi:site-specific DNA-methyltransferase (adenine-specific)
LYEGLNGSNGNGLRDPARDSSRDADGTGDEVLAPDSPFPTEYENAIIHSSAEWMSALPCNCLHLMVTSPPYNVTKEYDEDLSLKEYLGMLERVFAETYRVLVNGGRACVNVANLGRRPYIPLSDFISRMMLDIGFQMRGEIIWNKAAGAGVSMAWGSFKSASNPVLRDVHEYILVFSKGSFARKRLSPAKRADDSSEATGADDAEGSDAKHGDTITKEQFMEWTKSVWTFNPESARKIGHPAPFPVELPYRLTQLYTFAGDIVLDPFMGSGSTAIAALKSNRKYVGYEVDAEYVKLAEARIEPYKTQMGLGL